MKFSKTIMVEINAEPTSEEWFVNIYDSTKNYEHQWIDTPARSNYEEMLKAIPKEYTEIVERAYAKPLEKKYKKAPKQFWTLIEDTEEKTIQVSICHYYHFDTDYTTHINF